MGLGFDWELGEMASLRFHGHQAPWGPPSAKPCPLEPRIGHPCRSSVMSVQPKTLLFQVWRFGCNFPAGP